MANDRIHQARRAAKALSRSQDVKYQQALDIVAREAGYGTWSAMMAAHGETAAPAAPVASQKAASKPDWRTRELERLEGSRHSPVDEAGIATIGQLLGRIGEISGIPVIVIAAALPCIFGLLAVTVLKDQIVGIGDTVITTVLTIPFGLAILRSPDHRGARYARRSTRVVAGLSLMICICFTVPMAYAYGTMSVDHLWQGPTRIVIALLLFNMAMWGCAWEGRRIRREGMSTT